MEKNVCPKRDEHRLQGHCSCPPAIQVIAYTVVWAELRQTQSSLGRALITVT